jgi:hypothetical protein
MREGCKTRGHPRRGAAARGISDRGRPARGRGEGGKSNRWGPVDRETRERRLAREGVIRKGKHIFREDVTDARAGWAGRDDFWPAGTARPVG